MSLQMSALFLNCFFLNCFFFFFFCGRRFFLPVDGGHHTTFIRRSPPLPTAPPCLLPSPPIPSQRQSLTGWAVVAAVVVMGNLSTYPDRYPNSYPTQAQPQQASKKTRVRDVQTSWRL